MIADYGMDGFVSCGVDGLLIIWKVNISWPNVKIIIVIETVLLHGSFTK